MWADASDLGTLDRRRAAMLSSHLLGEVEAVADQLVVIVSGRVMARGPKDRLLAGRGTLVRALDPAGLLAALDTAGIAVTTAADGAMIADADPDSVGRAAAAAGVVLRELRAADSGGLEGLFLSLTAAQPSPASAGVVSPGAAR